MAETKARLISAAFTSTGDVRAENLDAGIDSADVVTLIDSAYVSVRAGASGLDSADVVTLIDSAYVTARAPAGGGAFEVDADDNIISSNSTSTPTVSSGFRNIVAGKDAGNSITTGDNNVFLGWRAGNSVTTNGGNIAIGQDAARQNTVPGISIGTYAGDGGHTSGAINIGGYAGYGVSGQNHGEQINIGGQAGSGFSGIYTINIGGSAGARTNSTSDRSDYCINIGYSSGQNINGGDENVAIGNYALGQQSSANVSGRWNVAIGHRAMGTANGGLQQNVAIGGYSGFSLTSGASNTVVGHYAGQQINTGSNNVCIGINAGSLITGGLRNTVVGYNSGDNITTGSDNTVIGSGNNISSAAQNYETVIGWGLTGRGFNTGFYGGAAGVFSGTNNSTWNTQSDERIKTNVTEYTLGLDTLNQVNVKTYNYLSDSDIAIAHPELADSDGLVHQGMDTEKTVVGVMAQELETVLPNSVSTGLRGIKSVNKDELFWVMLNSIKELKTANDSLVARVEALENA